MKEKALKGFLIIPIFVDIFNNIDTFQYLKI